MLLVLNSFPGGTLTAALDLQRRAVWISTPSSLCFVDFEETTPALPAPAKSRRRVKEGRSYVSAGARRVARVLQLDNICLLCAFIDTRSAVLVEKEWGNSAGEISTTTVQAPLWVLEPMNSCGSESVVVIRPTFLPCASLTYLISHQCNRN